MSFPERLTHKSGSRRTGRMGIRKVLFRIPLMILSCIFLSFPVFFLSFPVFFSLLSCIFLSFQSLSSVSANPITDIPYSFR